MQHNYIFKTFSRGEDKISVRRSVYIDNCLPIHGHNDFMEIVYIATGEGTHYLNDQKQRVKKGDLIVLNYHSVHTFEPITDDFEWINILFKPEFISDRLINEIGDHNMIKLSIFNDLLKKTDESNDLILNDADSSFSSLVYLMLEEYENLPRDNNYILKNYLTILLAKISFIYQEDQNAVEDTNVLVKQIMQVVSDNFHCELSLAFVADKVHLSPKYLSRFFKQQTGKNFIEYVHEKRIEEACRLLEQTDMSVNDIMFCCGIKSSKFFYKLFKEKTGLTPAVYRKNK